MRSFSTVLLIVSLFAFQTVSMAQTQAQEKSQTKTSQVSAKTIRQNMMKRLAELDKLKASGKIAEANTGYLVWIKKDTAASKDEKLLIDAENAERKTIYSAIAKQQKSTVENVGKRRAAQLRKIARKGHYCMDENGKLYQVEKDPVRPQKNNATKKAAK